MAFFGNYCKHITSQISAINKQISASNPSISDALRCMPQMKLFVGGLPWAVDDTDLHETFSKYGEVVEAKVINDRETDKSRGFGFVTFKSSEQASTAIKAMNGQDLLGRRVRVNFAEERAPRLQDFFKQLKWIKN